MAGEETGRDERLDERDGSEHPAAFLGDDSQLGEPGVVDGQLRDPERPGPRPQLGVEAGRCDRFGGPDPLRWHLLGEEGPEGVPERLVALAHGASAGRTSRESVPAKSMYSRLSARTTATLSGPA